MMSLISKHCSVDLKVASMFFFITTAKLTKSGNQSVSFYCSMDSLYLDADSCVNEV